MSHEISRVRHALRRRVVTVKTVERVTPNMVRVKLVGADLSGFVSAAYDDHLKISFPLPETTEPVMPELGPKGLERVEGVAYSPMRDYTPRKYDGERGELVIDFALHVAGPATEWARRAVPGQMLGLVGPRGSFVVTDDFDWYLFVGDETALPAIGRRVEELREGARVIVVASVIGPDEEQRFESRAHVEIIWVHRPLSQASDPMPLLEATKRVTPPTGDGYAWVAGESTSAKLIREHLIGERGLNKAWVKAAGYWKRGAANVHDTHTD
jgi:NADPH-dependent ferric siderophore reductase